VPTHGVNGPSPVNLLTASLDLQLVRLIRGAIANDPPTAGSARPAADVIADRVVLRPETDVARRVVYQPDAVVAAPVVFEPEAVELPARTRAPDVVGWGPLLAPWQMLLREKVWNRPVADLAPPPTPPTPPPATTGTLFDAVV
jgi:hypothetical protein